MQFSFDTNLNTIAAKIEAGERLSFDEGLELYKTDDLNALGKLAELDAALIVSPPLGLEAGYVPIVTRQGAGE